VENRRLMDALDHSPRIKDVRSRVDRGLRRSQPSHPSRGQAVTGVVGGRTISTADCVVVAAGTWSEPVVGPLRLKCEKHPGSWADDCRERPGVSYRPGHASASQRLRMFVASAQAYAAILKCGAYSRATQLSERSHGQGNHYLLLLRRSKLCDRPRRRVRDCRDVVQGFGPGHGFDHWPILEQVKSTNL